MRILHVIPSVDPVGGGPAEGVRQFCSIYQAHGHTGEVASLDAPQTAAGIPYPVPVHALGPGLGVFGYAPRAVPWLKQNVGRFDLVIIDAIWNYHALAAWSALQHADVPFAVFVHGMLDPYFKHRYPLKHIKKLLYWRAFLRPVVNNANAVLFTSEEEKILARQSFPDYHPREVVVPYGSFGPDCGTAAAAAHFLEKWPQLRGKRIAITMGRIHPKKGTDLLIAAFARTLARDPDWRLVIAGPDQIGWQARLQEQAVALGVADRIVWTGMLKGENKWGALSASEVFVLPSHQENFGIVVAEALACGLPALLSNKINIWREVERHNAGWIGSDTESDTADLLTRWQQLDSAQRLAMRERALQCFHAEFDYHSAERRLLGILQNLADQNRVLAC